MLMLQCDIIIFTPGGNKLRISYCFSKTDLGNKVKADRFFFSFSGSENMAKEVGTAWKEKKGLFNERKRVFHKLAFRYERGFATKRKRKDITGRRFLPFLSFHFEFLLKIRK